MNPYAPPQTDDEQQRSPTTASAEAPWRDGDCLVIPRVGAVLPPRCVVCNQPGVTHSHHAVFWYSRWTYLLLALAGIGFVLAAIVTHRRATFQLWLCEEHERWQRLGGITATLLSAGAGAWIVFSKPPLFGALLAFVVVGVAFWGLKFVRARRIDQAYAWLQVGRPFLESFQPRAGANVTPQG